MSAAGMILIALASLWLFLAYCFLIRLVRDLVLMGRGA